MRLTKLFMITTGILLTLVSIMLVRSVLNEWRTVVAAQRGLQAMSLAYDAMKVAEKASAERGPTVAIMGDGANGAAPSTAIRDRLASARKASDDALAAGQLELSGSTRADHLAAAALISRAQRELVAARTEVDRIAAMPHGERTAPGTRIMRGPIDKMFSVIDVALEAVTILSADAEHVYPELSEHLVGARFAAELREYAGRLGSQLTAPLAAQKPLGMEEKRDIPILIGRIEQLRRLIEVQTQTRTSDPRIVAAVAEMNSRYFAVGLPFIGELAAAGTSGQNYGLDSAQFVARYVPEMLSIVKLRDKMFERAREGATATYAQARSNLWINAAIGLAALAIEITVFLLIRRRVLKPLLANTRDVVAIAEGKLDTALAHTDRTDEIGDMQNAIAALKTTSERKRQLESDHERLIDKWQLASNVDFLTGLLNRRAFTERAVELLTKAKQNDWNVALILLDIDHFKDVNDRFGHSVGDTALTQIANVARSVLRTAQSPDQSDTLARYGGEEFIALLINCDQTAALTIAERIRVAIAEATLDASQGQTFSITSSFGVAAANARQISDANAFFILADRALYRAKAEGRNRVVAGDVTQSEGT